MDAKDIKELILTIDKTSIEKLELEKNDIRIVITKKAFNESQNSITSDMKNLEEKIAPSNAENFKRAKEEMDHREGMRTTTNDENTWIVKSPIVGTFYSASSPDAPPFVKIGDVIEKGQSLCIIEAMKIMNEIESEAEGEIVEILVRDEDIVEYGQPLMKIRR
ncbi:acetyl-CoA carboxylase biotin carboxyl carrier protein [Alkaliphilus oremlandii]|uniref:Biotin carboxyl carrier protein of acetyl-CoA carboxylase n=1 Tax=Alkaliphilus oremlandii (strain OhILAs) TaxID=350688 RepID=A8MLN9_ALKOO|nr:acetyl-CoA carboxylase biotin carboxyl carrier protein [Alkaliphilus oremlandii]ABW17956.1 acetyl-CoA carboxylase, biotin carboxyl carrier protein [Alkaliphilus oremlandii OhILAs]